LLYAHFILLLDLGVWPDKFESIWYNQGHS